MGVTVVGTGLIAAKGINYLLFVKPEKESRRLQESRELLEEGKSKDILPDLAPTLRT